MWEVDREWYQAAKTLHFGLKLLVGLLILLFSTSLFVDSAHAAVVQSTYDGVVWGIGVVEKPNGSSMEAWNPVEGCIVNAPNVFSAACFAVGGNPATLTSDQKALLSNASTGGDFYTFTQNFANYGGSFDEPDNWYVPKFYDVWHMFENLYGDDLYAATFSSAQLRGAKADYQTILDGGSLGGGSGGTVAEGGVYTLKGNSSTYPGWGYVIGTTLHSNTSIPTDTKLSLTETVSNYITDKLGTGYDAIFRISATNSNPSSNKQTGYIFFVPHGSLTMTTTENRTYSTDVITLTNNTGSAVQGYRVFLYFDKANTTIDRFVYSGDTESASGALVDYRINAGSSIKLGGGTNGTAGCFYLILYSDGSSSYPQSPDDPVNPPSNWPDNPTVNPPNPPELPSVDFPDVTINFPSPPTFPPQPSYTGVEVNFDLEGVIVSMANHCGHLQSAIYYAGKGVYDNLSTVICDCFEWLGDVIAEQMNNLMDYLHDLFEWLAEQFDYSITGTAYDDNTLISWLRKIYYRLGSGGVNTRPLDPVANPVDAGDWLSQLIANLFTALNALAGGLLTSVGSALDLMHTKFPFSLPWDLLAILALFEAPPTAPDFDVPIYTLSSAGQLLQVGAWEIDLSDLSPYLEGIRWMQKICFVYFLAVHTKDWMDTLEKVVA